MQESQFIDPQMLPRDHPLRVSYEAEQRANLMANITTQKFAQDEKMKGGQGENEKNFELHHEFLSKSVRENISRETAESVNKLLALTNLKDEELEDLEYYFSILIYKEINYSKKKDYTPAKSRAIEDLKMYFFAQIRRARGGWEREQEKEERKVLKTEFPIATRKKAGIMGRLFG